MVIGGVAPALDERHAPPDEEADADPIAVPEGGSATKAGLPLASCARVQPPCPDGGESEDGTGSLSGREASSGLLGALAKTHSLGRDCAVTPAGDETKPAEDDLILGDVPEVASDAEASPVAGLAAAPYRSSDSPPAVRPFPAANVAAAASAQSLRFMRPTAAALRRQRTLYGPPAPADGSSEHLIGAAGAPPSASISAALSPPHARRVESLMRSLDSLQPLMERQAAGRAAAASTHPALTGPIQQIAASPVQQQQQRMLPLAAEGHLPHPQSPSHRQATPPQPQLLWLPPAHPEVSVAAASFPLHAPLRQQVALQLLSPAPAPVRPAAPPLRRAGSQGHVAPADAANPPQLLVLTPQPVEHSPAGAVRFAAAAGAGVPASSAQPPLRRAVSDRGIIRRAPHGAPPSGDAYGGYVPDKPSSSAAQWRVSQPWNRREQSPPRSHPYLHPADPAYPHPADPAYAYRRDRDAAAYAVPREVPEEAPWEGWGGGGGAREAALSHGWRYAGHHGIPGQLPAEQPPQYQQQQQQGAWGGRDQGWDQRADVWPAPGTGPGTSAAAGAGESGAEDGRGWLRRDLPSDASQSSRLEGEGRGHPSPPPPSTWGAHYATSPPQWDSPVEGPPRHHWQHQEQWQYAASGPVFDGPGSGPWQSSSTWRQQPQH